MKKLYLSGFLMMSVLFLNAQVKFLFDATKAESSGNGDWVIDADLHNLGYSNGPAIVGQGSESNPQRYPTPAQSTITSTSPETTWEGALSSWAIDLVKKGYEVETLSYNGLITYGDSSNPQDLSHYKVFVVDEPNIQFTASEKTAILQFVYHGGGLFMISDHDQSDRNNDGWDSPHIWNDLMSTNSVLVNPFGITFDYNNYSGTYSNIANISTDSILHGVMGNVTEVQWSNGTTMTLSPTSNSSVKGLVYKTGTSGNTNVLCARARYGAGKVFAMGDSSPADDGTGDPNDQLYDGWITDANGNHERLIINASIWLADEASAINELNAQSSSINLRYSDDDELLKLVINSDNPEDNYRLSLFNLEGKNLMERNSVVNNQTITIPKPQHGLFIYRIISSKGEMKTGKIIVSE